MTRTSPRAIDPWSELELACRFALRTPAASRAAVAHAAERCSYATPDGPHRAFAHLLNILKQQALGWRDVPPDMMRRFEASIAETLSMLDEWPAVARATPGDLAAAKRARDERRALRMARMADAAAPAARPPYWIND